MDMRKLAIASLLAATTAVGSSLAAARTIEVVVAPPAPRHEVVPAPRHGYVWAPGYYAWNGHKHVWHSGRWIKQRHGERWVAHSWEQRGDRWYFRDGHWERG